MEKKASKILEAVFILAVAFVVIIIIFFALSFAFKGVKSLTGNVASEGGIITNNYVEWIVITLISTLAVVALLEYIIKRRLFKIKWNLD